MSIARGHITGARSRDPWPMSSANVRRDTTNSTVMWEVMTACMVMHNIIVEDKRDESLHDQG
jgi:hypothetical protein